MNTATAPDRDRLMAALQQAWRREPGVVEYKLTLLDDQIAQNNGSWAVPVASGVLQGSAHGLLRVLDRLEEAVEEQTHFDVSIFLDPRLPQSRANH